ncbi:MAG: hypothetical protein JWQ71_773 [Pedosphaera sp.]|nr:hypothetical protein [Pedosphaera sp.]
MAERAQPTQFKKAQRMIQRAKDSGVFVELLGMNNNVFRLPRIRLKPPAEIHQFREISFRGMLANVALAFGKGQ